MHSGQRADIRRRKEGGMLSMLVVLYLFLGGAGAGACTVTSLLALLCPREEVCATIQARGGAKALGTAESAAAPSGRRMLRAPYAYRRLLVPSFVAALGFLAAGAACLAFDLGRADRITLLLTSPAPTHITVGAWALVVCSACVALLICAWSAAERCWPDAIVRALEGIAIASGIATMLYTGFLLQSLNAVPLWTTFWMPALFALSSLSCGFALALTATQFTESALAFERVVHRMMKLDLAIIALEIAATVGLTIWALNLMGGVDAPPALWKAYDTGAASIDASSPTAAAAAIAAANLLGGKVSHLYWGGFAFIGLLVPLAMEAALLARARKGKKLSGVAAVALSACVLFGGFALRFCLVEAGTHPLSLLLATYIGG